MIRRGLTLHSVEHCEAWLKELEKVVSTLVLPGGDDDDDDNGGSIRRRWFPHHVARTDGSGCEQREGSYLCILEMIGYLLLVNN